MAWNITPNVLPLITIIERSGSTGDVYWGGDWRF
jgi:hypothetical protein